MNTTTTFLFASAALAAFATMAAASPLPGLSTHTTASEQVLHTFNGVTDGKWPMAALIRGRDGNFYGTTNKGPHLKSGTIFRMTPDGALTTLYIFPRYNPAGAGGGAYPSFGSLVEDNSGNFYGATIQGGARGFGTIYKLAVDGSVAVIHSFDGSDGAGPYGGLVWGRDGSLYGTTTGFTTGEVPLRNLGSVFRITTDGVITVLHAFTGNGQSAMPVSLMQGSDGNFYGTTAGQANFGLPGNDEGSVFRMTPDGALTTLHQFKGGSDDGFPVALIENNGTFYGTTAGYFTGTATTTGTVFSITPAGQFTTLHALNAATDGANPNAGLVLAPDGNFYGTAFSGGASNLGTLFQITPGGDFETIHSFAGGSDGASPAAALQGGRSVDVLYGATEAGGQAGDGTIFRISLIPAAH